MFVGRKKCCFPCYALTFWSFSEQNKENNNNDDLTSCGCANEAK